MFDGPVQTSTLMLDRLVTLALLVIAVIHILPVSGIVGVDRLTALYGVDISDPNLEILMRHRAALFAILGGFFAFAAFRPALQPAAFLMALASIGSFFLLSYSVGEFNTAIRRVVIADVVAAFFLVAAVGIYIFKR